MKNNVNKLVAKLEELVARLENKSEVNLDEDIKDYEQAMELVSQIKKILGEYELKVNEIKEKYAE